MATFLITYQDYLDSGDDPLFPTRDTGRIDGAEQVRCGCGSWDWPVQLLNVSVLPDIVTDGEIYVCPTCRSLWQRTLKKFDPADDFIHWAEWEAEFALRMGASNTDIAAYKSTALTALEMKLPRIIKREQVYIDAIANGTKNLDAEKKKYSDEVAAIANHIATLTVDIAALTST